MKSHRVGGCCFSGYVLEIKAEKKFEILDVSFSEGCAINSIAITPQVINDSDKLSVFHLGKDKKILATIIENVNMLAPMRFELLVRERMDKGEFLSIKYEKAGPAALRVFVTVERGS